jgi:predicted transposase/invertase (TIGR01784 family)
MTDKKTPTDINPFTNAEVRKKYDEILFNFSELDKMSDKNSYAYHEKLKYYRDLKNSYDTAWEDGRAEGREKGRQEGVQECNLEIAKAMLEEGIDIKTIVEITGLTEEMILQ